jgi:polyhydroxybutyrate depolymerase
MKNFGSFVLCTFLTCLANASIDGNEYLTIDGETRSFLVNDFSHSATEKTALVIVLHGGGGNGGITSTQTNFDQVARREGLIVTYPNGTSGTSNNLLLTWNAAHCCSYAMRQEKDDVEFIRQIIDYLIATRNVDPKQVFVTGLSNGGMLTHRLGYELPDKITAIAPVIASLFGDEPLRKFPVPVLTINGSIDERVKVNGGDLGGIVQGGDIGSVADLPTLPITSQGDYWAKVNSCTSFTDANTTHYTLRTYAGCTSGGAVQNYVVKGMGHSWPGGTQVRPDSDPPVNTVNANELIWDFFKQFRRSAPVAQTNTAYYYDGALMVPAVESGGSHYRAKLQLLPGLPMSFAVSRLETLTGNHVHNSHYSAGVLSLTPVVAGDKAYQAELKLQKVDPLTFQIDKLTPIP